MSIHEQVKSFTEDIEASYETRKAAVAHLARGTHQALEQFQRDHKKRAGELMRSLAAHRARRTSQVQKMRARNKSDLKERAGENKARIETVHTLLVRFAREHEAMADGLRSELSTFQKNLSQAVNGLLGEFSLDHRQARAHLNRLSQEMAAKRTGKSADPLAVEKAVRESQQRRTRAT